MLTFEAFVQQKTTKPKSGYMAYVLTDSCRNALLRHFEPKNSEVICHHVTWKMPAKENEELPPAVHEAHVIGYASEDGLEALVVEVNGHKTQHDGRRPLHITLSLDRAKGFKPMHSSDVINRSFKHITPIALHLEPKFISQ